VSDQSLLDRRALLQIASGSLLAGTLPVFRAESCSNANHQQHPGAAEVYTPQFFTPEELQLLDLVTEAILPADEHSPGAREAKVSLFADLIVSTSPSDVQADWRNGLRLLREQLKTSSLDQWLAEASANEHKPNTVLDLFFVKLKQTTIEGYYTSAIGIHQDLRYIGNSYQKEWKGCTHEEHQTGAASLRGSGASPSSDLGNQPSS
jgi:hypothetical protein